MSTESGLPDFRSAGGLWRNRRFEELASVEALERDFENFVAFYRWRIETLGQHAPHAGHRLLAEWQRKGQIQALITQNVDGYHQAAGSPQAIELHGSLRRVRCRGCGAEASAAAFMTDGGIFCDACGDRRRPGVVLFGERLPGAALEAAEAAATRAELFIVLGSSLVVSPANWFPQLAKVSGARLVIVNNEPTPLDDLADLVIHSGIGETLAAVDAALGSAPVEPATAVAELNEAIARRESVIRSLLIAQAIHELLPLSLEAADTVEQRLLDAGYERAARGDWFYL